MSRTAQEWSNILEEAVELISSDYSPEQWKRKDVVDKARFDYIESIVLGFNEAVDLDDIEYGDFDDTMYHEWKEDIDEMLKKLQSYMNTYLD